MMETLTSRGEQIDWCVVGEPSSTEALGDLVKNGRRGSLNARPTVHGKQGTSPIPTLPITRFTGPCLPSTRWLKRLGITATISSTRPPCRSLPFDQAKASPSSSRAQ